MSALSDAKKRLLEEDYVPSKKKKHTDSAESKKHKHKKEKKHKKKKSKRRHKSSSESSNDSDASEEWVEKPSSEVAATEKKLPRDDWLNISDFKVFTRKDLKAEVPKEKKDHIDSYVPSKSSRELNPYWRENGTGLPSVDQKQNSKFKKPAHEADASYTSTYRPKEDAKRSSGGSWRKSSETKSNVVRENKEIVDSSESFASDRSNFLTDEEMNKLGAKIVKAEILGNTTLVAELTAKLEKAREHKKQNPQAKVSKSDNTVLLTTTNDQGNTRPLAKSFIGDARSKGKKNMETHSLGGERIRFYADDDKYSLKQMFEQEKFGNTNDDEEFVKSISKLKNPNDDLDEIFTERARKNKSEAKSYTEDRNKAINQHQTMQRSLDTCEYCFESDRMNKKMVISTSGRCYLALLERMSLVENHCILSTISHISCSTTADEDVWCEIMSFRKALTKMFSSQNEDVIFFETAVYLHKYPHLLIHCVPLPRDKGDMMSIYFKKALLECETEWSNNKKVIDLKGKNVRKGVPKGLPYFWVDFGIDPGFAHIIEDQQLFPKNFAQEIIGGILDLDHKLWRKPQKESSELQYKKVSKFSKIWKNFDPNI